jgi:hypothetical protein
MEQKKLFPVGVDGWNYDLCQKITKIVYTFAIMNKGVYDVKAPLCALEILKQVQKSFDAEKIVLAETVTSLSSETVTASAETPATETLTASLAVETPPAIETEAPTETPATETETPGAPIA